VAATLLLTVMTTTKSEKDDEEPERGPGPEEMMEGGESPREPWWV